MDGFNEKKWFVYLGDHHEGPFSMGEIQDKMAEGQVSRASYVWTEGMSDWRPMEDVTAFISVSPSKPAAATQTGTPSIPVENTIMAAADGTIMSMRSPSEPSIPSIPEPTPEPLPLPDPEPSMPAPETPAADDAPPPVVETKEDKAAAKADAKEAKRLAKEAKKQAKEDAKAARAGMRANEIAKAAGERGERKGGGLLKVLIVVAVPVAVGVLYHLGFLEPLVQNPAVKAMTTTIGDLSRPYLLKLTDKVPALGQWISPIPSLDDVTNEDFEILKKAAMSPEPGMPVKSGLAVSRADLLLPTFYVSSALEDGAAFDVYVEGIPETLLNHMSFVGRSQVVLAKRIGRSLPVKFPDGKPLPRGEYVVYAYESDAQPEAVKAVLGSAAPAAVTMPATLPQGRKLVSRRTFFLGGLKDANYQQRLKEYHDRLMTRAKSELNETKQFAATLESQLGTSTARFTSLRRPKGRLGKAQMKQWNDFHAKWMQLDGQLGQNFQKWTPEVLQNEYFYGMIYTLVQHAGQAVGRVHGQHHAYFTGAVDPKSYDVQLGETLAQAQNTLKALKAKIEQAEKIPPTPNGMPRKEGL